LAPTVLQTTSHSEGSEALVEFSDNRLLIDLCGEFDRNLAQIEQALDITILRKGNNLVLLGPEADTARGAALLRALYERLEQGRTVTPADIDAALRLERPEIERRAPDARQFDLFGGGEMEIRTRKRVVEPRSPAQRAYVKALFRDQLVFGIGPAGTGKTYLAVAVAVAMFIEGAIDRIVLSRPAVEAGERLGFLPGDMKEKVDPYMQPLYDALGDFLPGRQLARMMEENQIEIAPLAFMRGRTLSNAFIVLDEAQNATEMQMKMFLTRIGEGSRMAVTGDVTQIDLPHGTRSGLVQASRLLEGVQGVSLIRFGARDVVRHPLVARIIEAYDKDRPTAAD